MTREPNSRSAELFARATSVLPAGVSRNTLLHDGPLLYAHHGKGCRVTDVDGVERIDFSNNMASQIHGQAFAPIVEAVTAQLQLGTAFTMATEAEIRFAEHMCGRSPSFDKIRFVNSGTEAVMAGMKAARAFTNRPKIAKVEGSYHGAYDYAEVSQAPGPENWGDLDQPAAVPLAQGTPTGLVDDMVILPFNDVDQALAVLNEHGCEIACVLLDPLPHRVGMLPVADKFVQALHGWTTQSGALLMFDEVIAFRSEVGGMQERLDLRPDLTAMGKLIGGGFPVGALAGRGDVMDVFAQGDRGLRLPLSGTFSANPITMTAGFVAMSHFGKAEVHRLNKLGDYARQCLAEVVGTADVPATVTGAGSLLRLHLKPVAPKNYRDAYLSKNEKQALSALITSLYDQGIMMIHTGSAALSTPMEKADVDVLSDAVFAGLKSIRSLLTDPK